MRYYIDGTELTWVIKMFHSDGYEGMTGGLGREAEELLLSTGNLFCSKNIL